MRESRRVNLIITGSIAAIALALAVYAVLAVRWLAAPMSPRPAPSVDRAQAAARLVAAREAFRADLLDPRAYVRLSEALWNADRRIDSFYVLYDARTLFPPDEFARAHAEIVLDEGGPAAEERDRLLRGESDPTRIIVKLAELERDYPDSPEGRAALDQLSRLASGDEYAQGGDAARLAMAALRDLSHASPDDADRFAALAKAYIGRGQAAQARALAVEELQKRPGQAGAARVMGLLALQGGDADAALSWLLQAWKGDPDDAGTAAALARIYDKQRADPESALPFYLALYRLDPASRLEGPVELRAREILDARRADLLRGVTVDGLGRRLRLGDASLRAQACLSAAAFKDPRWIDALGERLDDDTEIVRQSADYALFKIAQAVPAAVRARREPWLSSDKPLVRIRALNLFADLDGANAFPRTVQALSDPNPAVRAYAKVMVLDHYYRRRPEYGAVVREYLAHERDPRALAFERLFSGAP